MQNKQAVKAETAWRDIMSITSELKKLNVADIDDSYLRLTDQRLILIQRFFSEHPAEQLSDDLTETIMADIETIKKFDQKARVSAENSQGDIIKQIKQFSQGKKSAKMYQDQQGSA